MFSAYALLAIEIIALLIIEYLVLGGTWCKWHTENTEITEIASQARRGSKCPAEIKEITERTSQARMGSKYPAEPMEQRKQNHVLHELCRVALA